MQDQLGNIFSGRLKALRGDRKKAEFGRFLGIPNSPTYQRYEDGRIPDAETLQRIAERCKVSVDWLLGREAEALREAAAERPMDYQRVFRLAVQAMSAEQLIERQGVIIEDADLSDEQRLAAVRIITAELAARRRKHAPKAAAGPAAAPAADAESDQAFRDAMDAHYHGLTERAMGMSDESFRDLLRSVSPQYAERLIPARANAAAIEKMTAGIASTDPQPTKAGARGRSACAKA